MGKPGSLNLASNPQQNSPSSSEESAISLDVDLPIHETAKNSRSGIYAHRHHIPLQLPINQQDQPTQPEKDNKDTIDYLNKIKDEIDMRKLIRSKRRELKLSKDNGIPDSDFKEQKQKSRHTNPCSTYRIPSEEKCCHDLQILNAIEIEETSQSSHTYPPSKDNLIAYDMHCEEGLMDFLNSSSQQFEDVLIWESKLATQEINIILDESEEDQEILDYVSNQKMRRDRGENVTGEIVYKDEKTGKIRNLHRDSVSITLYNIESDYDDDFGKTDVFHPIMTMKEKLMLGLIPAPGWKKKEQRKQKSRNQMKTQRKGFLKSKETSPIPVTIKQGGVLEVTKIEIVANTQGDKNIRKSINETSKKNSHWAQPQHLTTLQNGKDILVRALPNPNFEIKQKFANKELEDELMSKGMSDSKIYVVPIPKSTNLLFSEENNNQDFDIHGPSTPQRIKTNYSNKRSADPLAAVSELSDFGVQQRKSYTKTTVDDSNSDDFLSSPIKSRKINRTFRSDKRYYSHRHHPASSSHPKTIHSHRDNENSKTADEYSYPPNPSHSEPFKQSKKKLSGDTTYRMEKPFSNNNLPERPPGRFRNLEDNYSTSSEDSIRCRFKNDDCSQAGCNDSNSNVGNGQGSIDDLKPKKVVNYSISSPRSDFIESSDKELSMIFNKKRFTSDSSTDNDSHRSYGSYATGSSISSRTTRSVKEQYHQKGKANRESNCTSTSTVPSDKFNDDTGYQLPTTPRAEADGDTRYEFFETDPGSDDNNFIQTIFYDFPLDNNGSSVAISVTLPFQVPADSLPLDSPNCAYSILNKARKLLKKNCANESNSSQSNENLNTNLMPMRYSVDIEEIFSERESCSGRTFGVNKQLKNQHELRNKSFETRQEEHLVSQQLDKEIQTPEFGCGEDCNIGPLTKNRKIESPNVLRHFLVYIFSCGCLRRPYKVEPAVL